MGLFNDDVHRRGTIRTPQVFLTFCRYNVDIAVPLELKSLLFKIFSIQEFLKSFKNSFSLAKILDMSIFLIWAGLMVIKIICIKHQRSMCICKDFDMTFKIHTINIVFCRRQRMSHDDYGSQDQSFYIHSRKIDTSPFWINPWGSLAIDNKCHYYISQLNIKIIHQNLGHSFQFHQIIPLPHR